MGLSLRGTTSGAVDINAPAVAGDNTITLPGNNGGANQFYKNSGTAGIVTHSSMVEDSSGRIGIGTDNPSDELSVVSSLTTDSVLRLQGGNSAGKGSGIRLMKGASAVGYIGPESWLFGSSNTSDTLVISQNAQANLSITSAGNIGINDNNPGMRLCVKGAVTAGAGNNEDLQQWNIGSDNVKAEIKYLDAAADRGMLFGTTTDHNLLFQSNNTERMRVGNTGNTSIGTATNTNKLRVHEGSDNANIIICTGADESSEFLSLGILNGTPVISAGGVGSTDAELAFRTSESGTETERMRITNEGKVRIGDGLTSAAGELFQVIRDGGGQGTNDCLAYFETGQNDWIQKLYFNASGTAYFFDLQQQGTRRGAVFYDGTMNYSDGSDYRLKENVVPLVNAIDRVKQLQPCTYNFIEHGPEKEYDGFLAHELAEVCPYAVKGEKDAVNEDGSPDIQVIDRSHVIPLLAAALQEAITKIETLETQNADLLSRVTALEG